MPPTKFTAETRAALLERIAAGASLPDACRPIGLRPKTAQGWLTHGRREKTGPHAEFAAAVDEARRKRKRPEPMDEDELRTVVAEAARGGSVSAMRLQWEMICAEDAAPLPNTQDEEPRDGFEELDELAARRNQAAS